MTARDPRARRAERIRERVIELMEAPAFGAGTREQIRRCMFDLFPGSSPSSAEVRRALGVLGRERKVRYDRLRRLWRVS